MWNPKDYAQHSDAQLKWAQELRSRLNLQGNEALLDVGCGDGKITADFAHAIPQGHIVGIDSSPEMVDYATQTYPRNQYPNLEFFCMDAQSLVFNQTFDVIFSNAVLHWVADHLSFLTTASQLLKPGGKLMISCGGQGNAKGILATFSEITQKQPWTTYFASFKHPYTFHGTEVYAAWLPQVGLQVQQLALVPKDMTHPGAAGLAGWIRTTWMPFTQCVPELEQEPFIQDFVTTYINHFPLDAEGLSHVEMVRLEVEARKPL